MICFIHDGVFFSITQQLIARFQWNFAWGSSFHRISAMGRIFLFSWCNLGLGLRRLSYRLRYTCLAQNINLQVCRLWRHPANECLVEHSDYNILREKNPLMDIFSNVVDCRFCITLDVRGWKAWSCMQWVSSSWVDIRFTGTW